MLARLLLQLGIWPASISHSHHWASGMRTFSSGLLWQCEPDFSDLCNPVSLGVTWDMTPPTQRGQQWILRKEGPETCLNLSLPSAGQSATE